jgi:hypothetical protein
MAITGNAAAKLDRLCNEVLTEIEASETRLLNWGFVDVRSDLDRELPTLIEQLPTDARALWEEARASGTTPASVLENLVQRRLIFKSRGAYRSRFAEAIRLLFMLRQRFSPSEWQTAPRRVSDLKVQLQRRRYPRRDVHVGDLLAELRALNMNEPRLQAIERLLTADGGRPLQLARFQAEAIVQQYRNLQQASDRAMAIGAGTGAGKTKAFYVPALAEIAATVAPAHSAHWVRALAIYPRVELLKDQLAEAFSEARKLDDYLKVRGLRAITVGAYYGDTPQSAQAFLRRPPESWSPNGTKDGWICPFFPCPRCQASDLVWYRDDVKREEQENRQGTYGRYARLRCPKCEFEVGYKHLLLTREHLMREPPDILFTTTEMLNRRLSRGAEHPVFGVGTPTPPRLLLLDEIHTYDGLNGAQVAYLLRRWRHARGQIPRHSLCIVGLSATLTRAETFLSRLTGIPPYRVDYISPREDDLVDEGVEYNVVLKGDPVSGTSLLSTSVQTAMLLGRILDPDSPGAAQSASRGAYGSKIFAFTDKLDVINRWYHIEQDAETHKALSQFRDYARSDGASRDRINRAGQDWEACARIGHDLRAPLRLGLTSSQHRGVRANADLIIATSTLEVGFNDPTVGAVVQHKAPRSMASFLQRKGRAGRTREMRPWMVVVTSAYGRDRWAFQHAESLFSPLLPAIDLPLDNYYVRKIQACYTLMDWLACTLKAEGHIVDVWQLLSSDDRGRNAGIRGQRRQLARVLRSILDGTRLDAFSHYLCRAFGVPDDERDQLLSATLWEEPRSLLFDVVPTLLRQVESDWQGVSDNAMAPWSDTISSTPMPDYAPPNLFSELNLPELTLTIPIPASGKGVNRRSRAAPARTTATSPGAETRAAPPAPGSRRAGARPTPAALDAASGADLRKDEHLMLLLGMTEFAPGHVNKRYSRSTHLKEAHWLALPDDAQLSRGKLPLQYLRIDTEPLPGSYLAGGIHYRVFRPRVYALDLVPESVKSSSGARLIWRSHFAPQDAQPGPMGETPAVPSDAPVAGNRLSLSAHSSWARIFPAVRAYTHANGAWVAVTRLATAVHAETRHVGGGELRRTLEFEQDGEPAALGFSMTVDALQFHYSSLDVGRLLADPAWPGLYHHLGPEYFLHQLQHDQRLAEGGLSTFEIDWLWQVEMSMLVATAVGRRCSLEQAAAEVDTKRLPMADRTMRVIFQSLQLDDSGEDDEAGRLHMKLMRILEEPVVQSALRSCERVLWDPPDDGLGDWLSDCYASSLGASLFAALVQLVPDIDPDDLVLDVEGDSIWISEAAGGGVGLITKIADAIAQHPRDFDMQMRDSLENCDREQLALHLGAVAREIGQDAPQLAEAFARVRQAGKLRRQEETRRSLARTLEQLGVPAMREVVVALNTKFLRPNSGPDSDRLVADLARRWDEEERRIGCAIDLRVMAVAARQIPEIERQVAAVLGRVGGPSVVTDESQVFNLLQSMLWLSCHDSCPDCIERRQPFQDLARPSRSLLLTNLRLGAHPIPFGESGWEGRVRQRLVEGYHAEIACMQDDLETCKQHLLGLATAGVECGFQFFYPVVDRVARTGHRWIVELTIAELVDR